MRWACVIVLLFFATTLRGQVFKDFSVKAGLAANSLHHREKNGATYKVFARHNTPYNYLNYFFALNPTVIFGKRVNIEMEAYLIAKGYKSSEKYIADNKKGGARINYGGFAIPFKWKFKVAKTARSRRFYLITAPRIDFELSIQKEHTGARSVYDSTRKALPGFYIAPGIEWKREQFSLGIELFYSVDLTYVYHYTPGYYEPIDGKHRTVGLVIVCRRYYMKSKDFYNKYY